MVCGHGCTHPGRCLPTGRRAVHRGRAGVARHRRRWPHRRAGPRGPAARRTGRAHRRATQHRGTGLHQRHTHLADGFAKELGFGQPYWEVFMPPDGLRHRALAATTESALEEQLGRTLDHAIACGTAAFADFREGGAAGAELLRRAAGGRAIRPIVLGRMPAYPLQDDRELAANLARLDDAQLGVLEGVIAAGDGFSLVSANDLTDPALRQVGRVVRDRGKLLALHVSESPPYAELSRARTGRGDVQRVIEHLRPDVAVHLTAADPAEFAALAGAGIAAACCPRNHAVIGLGIPRFDLMLAAGMRVALGTDNALLCSPDLLAELQFASRVIRAVRGDASFPTAVQMLQLITVHPARMFHLDGDLGWLAPGKRADLVVFDRATDNLHPVTDPVAALVNRAVAADIAAVLHGGDVVHGRLPGLG
ncbi:MAG: amidohydrolase family protein [Acidimicrobiia bacterium]